MNIDLVIATILALWIGTKLIKINFNQTSTNRSTVSMNWKHFILHPNPANLTIDEYLFDRANRD